INGGVREVIFRTTDGGLNWLEESSDLSTACYDAVMLSKTLGFVAADEAILKYGTVTEVTRPFEIPIGYILKDCYPNPFNSTTTIEYELPERTWVELKVFDILGREVAILVNEEQSSGIYKKHFNATRLTSGIYLYKLITLKFQSFKQMMLIK
ncbi:MAG: T9SS type A sorting domain-containing protein, partial [Bacteroidota bacterium]|nr:T9SS type A sorting domain-containing protein [Bacteroidota bacterium]